MCIQYLRIGDAQADAAGVRNARLSVLTQEEALKPVFRMHTLGDPWRTIQEEIHLTSYPAIFTYTITVPQSAIDEYGHVNNVIYVQWMQEAAIRQGESLPEYSPPENTGWYVREHRIEYLTPAYLGDELEVRTWLSEMKRVRAIRRYEFIRKADGKVIARGETQWIFVQLTTGRPIAIPAEIQVLFPVLPDPTGSTPGS